MLECLGPAPGSSTQLLQRSPQAAAAMALVSAFCEFLALGQAWLFRYLKSEAVDESALCTCYIHYRCTIPHVLLHMKYLNISCG